MTRTLAFIFAALLLNGCSGAIKNRPTQASAAGSIEDLTQSKYKASEAIEAESAQASLVSNREGCEVGGVFRGMPNKDLTEGTTITETRLSAKLGEGLLQTNGNFEIIKNDGSTLGIHKTFTRAGATYSIDENCSNSEKGYQCPFAAMQGKPFSAGNYCNLVSDDSKPVVSYDQGNLSEDSSNPQLSSFVIVTTKQQGEINCHGKDKAPGSIIKRVVYSAEMPSLTGDGCAFGEVYENLKLLNADGTIRETQSREITGLNKHLVL